MGDGYLSHLVCDLVDRNSIARPIDFGDRILTIKNMGEHPFLVPYWTFFIIFSWEIRVLLFGKICYE